MAFFLGEADDLIFDGGTIPRSDPFDPPCVHRGEVQVFANDVMGGSIGVSDPAGKLFHVEPVILPRVEGEDLVGLSLEGVGDEGERDWWVVADLWFADGEVNSPAVEPCRRAGFEAAKFKSEVAQTVTEGGRGVPHSTAFLILETNMEESAHECSSGHDDGSSEGAVAKVGLHPRDGVVGGEDADGISLAEGESVRRLERGFGTELIGLFIALGPWGAHGGPTCGVEHPELDGRGIRVQPHEPTQRVDLANDLSFGLTADGGIAGHLTQGIEILGQE